MSIDEMKKTLVLVRKPCREVLQLKYFHFGKFMTMLKIVIATFR